MTDRSPGGRRVPRTPPRTTRPRSAIGESLARAAQKSGLGQLADGETPTGAALLGALGGFRGLAETILPGLVFLILFTFTQNVPLSIGCSVLVAIVFTVVRLDRQDAGDPGDRRSARRRDLGHPRADHRSRRRQLHPRDLDERRLRRRTPDLDPGALAADRARRRLPDGRRPRLALATRAPSG